MSTADPHHLRQILFLQSLEATDALGKVMPHEQRERATREAPEDETFLHARTQKLLSTASEPVRRLADWMAHPTWRWFRWVQIGLPLAAFLVGWLTNELGSERIVNIIAFPLLGLILWNVLVCGWMLVAELRHRPAKARPWPQHRLREQLEKHLSATVPDSVQREILSRSSLNFLTLWRERTAGTMRAQLKFLFHLGAWLLAGGIVASMYAQGLRKEYRAGWESTFLQPSSVQTLLGVTLGPASALTQIPLPTTEALAKMQLHDAVASAPEAPNAAPFIHLWAATAGIFIGIPRLLLIALALREARKQRPQWEPELTAYAAAARQAAAGQVSVVEVLPVYFTPEAASAEAIRQCILQQWGGKARVNFLSPMELGEETEYLAAWTPASHGTVLAFSFASTPEQDVQGEVIQQVAARASNLLVVTDALSFESRHGTLPEFPQRVAQREAAWRRVIGDTLPWLNLTPQVVKHPLSAMDALRARA